jgi:hypothetical protein
MGGGGNKKLFIRRMNELINGWMVFGFVPFLA